MISFFITILILWLIPNYFSKFELVEDFDKNFNTINNKFFYEDLDNDGYSERIILFDNTRFGNKVAYHIHKSNGEIVDQFNLRTEFCGSKIAWFQDANHNGIKEIYILARSNDSLFLHIQEHTNLRNPIEKTVFIDKLTNYNGVFDINIGRDRIIKDVNYDKDFIHFAVTAGYGGNPRKVYRYNIKNDEILKSPHFTNSGGISNMVDIDNDGKKEILLNLYATANTIDSTYTKRSDYKIWLTVLDDDLQFLFEPIGFDAIGGYYSISYKDGSSNYLLSLIRSAEHSKIPSKLLKLTTKGKILKEKKLPKGTYNYIEHFGNGLFILDDKENGKYHVFNSDLEIIKTYQIDKLNTGYFYDVNKDGTKEWVFYNANTSKLIVYDANFKHKVSINYLKDYKMLTNMGVRYPENGDSQIFLQFDRGIIIYSYKENPYYNLRYVFYIGVYIAVLAFTFLMAKGQQLREQKKRKLEQEISELQLKTIKNKVDPHFVFNALNTISEMTLTDNKLEADNFITKYAGFMRKTLENSDKIATSLNEELEYTKNFIELQQIRHQHSFEYKIVFDKKIDKKLKVPKHILFTYVENAIKYGLANKPKGLLIIDIRQEENKLSIKIKDNGWGFRKGHQQSNIGTGNGLKIMNKIFDLYENRYQTKITQEIHELKANNDVLGVEVRLTIQLKNN